MTDKIQLFKYAVDYLSKYSSSKKNLERILKKKILRMKIEKKDRFKLYESIPQILINLEKNKFIDDISYATSKIRNFISIGKSKLYIKNYLIKKGIESEIINEVFSQNEIDNLDWEINSARIFIRKRNLSKESHHREKNLAKMARAGFTYEISKKVLDEA